MSRPALNKSSLKNQRDQLKLYKQYLPSLDLKRQQFLGLVKAEEKHLGDIDNAINEAIGEADEWLPFLANEDITLNGLVRVKDIDVRYENQLGVTLPQLGDISFERRDYSTFQKPIWVDGLVALLEEVSRLTCEKQLSRKRSKLLRAELQTITQRVNLFDKVLIPSAKDNIREIGIALSDMERAGVVRAKLAKKKRQQRGV
ncbi:MAG: V-type ATP synthase subunit D [Desulfobulbaceae bacterium]|nr:V-type ATP synthase subunit D [Desulfobulbaceae bacterium]